MEVDWLVLSQYGEHWREGRKVADRSLRPGAVSLYHQRIKEKTNAFLGQLLVAPADFRSHIGLSVFLVLTSFHILEMVGSRRFQAKLITSLVYGYDLKENDEIIEASVQLGNTMFRLALPGATLVNYLPFRMNPLDDRRQEEELTIPRQCDISPRGSLG